MTDDTAPYRGELRYVFVAPSELFDATVAFYRDALGFPVAGGFSHGVYLQASVGVIEVIRDQPEPGREAEPSGGYRPASKGWLLIEVPDLDDTHRRLLESRVVPLWKPTDRPWRFRDVGVKDPCGNLICLFRRLIGWEEHHGGGSGTA